MVTIRQIKSPIRRHYKQRLTLIGLGLNKIGRVVELTDTPETLGMIEKLKHLVEVLGPPQIAIDFVRDFARGFRGRLDNAGYEPVTGESDDDSITRYLNVLNRRIEPAQRHTKKAVGFACPPHEAAGLQMLLQESESDIDLRPRQSLNIDKANYDDGLLNDWGIHHLHLGSGPHPTRPQFKARSGPVLYAYVTDDTLYCLAVLNHQEWSNQKLLDGLHQNFPELTKKSIFKSSSLQPSGLAVKYSDQDVQQLRNAGINAITERPDGLIMIGPGGGVTLSRQAGHKSAKVALAKIDLVKTIEELEKAAIEKIRKVPLPATIQRIDVRLTEIDGKFIARDPASGLRLEVTHPIIKKI